MAIDRNVVGTALPATRLHVERGRLRLFCKAIGETDPIYLDVHAARAAGHPDLPVPPTFLCALQHEHPDPFGWLDAIGVRLAHILHGEQDFAYHAMAYAGVTLTAHHTIADVYSKKGGALEFIVRDTTVTADDGRAIADLRDVIVVRDPKAVS